MRPPAALLIDRAHIWHAPEKTISDLHGSQAGFVPRARVLADQRTELTTPARLMTFVERCRLEELVESGHSAASAARVLNRHRSVESSVGERPVVGTVPGSHKTSPIRAGPAPSRASWSPTLPRSARFCDAWNRCKSRADRGPAAQGLSRRSGDVGVTRDELARQVKTALRTGRTQRKPLGRITTDSRGRIKDMINISERPAEADDRAIPGHWEGGLILGAHGTSAIGTLVERTTGFVMLLHLHGDHTAATIADAMTEAIPKIPEILRRSLTWDQGKEMALHTKLTEATGLPIYVCDPHSPPQLLSLL
jgi:IS30 family transposase